MACHAPVKGAALELRAGIVQRRCLLARGLKPVEQRRGGRRLDLRREAALPALGVVGDLPLDKTQVRLDVADDAEAATHADRQLHAPANHRRRPQNFLQELGLLPRRHCGVGLSCDSEFGLKGLFFVREYGSAPPPAGRWRRRRRRWRDVVLRHSQRLERRRREKIRRRLERGRVPPGHHECLERGPQRCVARHDVPALMLVNHRCRKTRRQRPGNFRRHGRVAQAEAMERREAARRAGVHRREGLRVARHIAGEYNRELEHGWVRQTQ